MTNINIPGIPLFFGCGLARTGIPINIGTPYNTGSLLNIYFTGQASAIIGTTVSSLSANGGADTPLPSGGFSVVTSGTGKQLVFTPSFNGFGFWFGVSQ